MCNEVKCIWVKCSEVLINRVSNIIRRYADHMTVAACIHFIYWFGYFFIVSDIRVCVRACVCMCVYVCVCMCV
jgi:hypothetical protein